MEPIKESLSKIKIKKSESKRKVNVVWEEAQEFGEYVGLKTTFVLRLFKIYGKDKVLSLKSDLRDIECDKSRFAGLVIWKLQKSIKQAQ